MTKVHYKLNNKIGIITIDSPPVNSLNEAVFSQLEGILENITDNVSVLIIESTGGKGFVAGADIKELIGLSVEEAAVLSARGQVIFSKLAKIKQPIIAAIDGFTLGAGLELALACDMRLATKRSIFGLPEVKLGVIPGYGGTQRLTRLIGIGKAMQLILTGDPIAAEEAYKLGLIEEIVETDVSAAAYKLAEAIASRAPLAVQQAKQAIVNGRDLELEASLELETKLFSELFNTTDKTEGIAAFLEKRQAKFKGK